MCVCTVQSTIYIIYFMSGYERKVLFPIIHDREFVSKLHSPHFLYIICAECRKHLYPDPNKTPVSGSEQNTCIRIRAKHRIQIRTNHQDLEAKKTPVSGSEKNIRIQVRTKHPDPDPHKTPRSASEQNTRI